MAERIQTEEEITKGMLDGTEDEIAAYMFADDDPEGDDGDTSLEEMSDVPGEVEEGDEPDETDQEQPEHDIGQYADDEGDDTEDDEARAEDHEQETEAADGTPQGRPEPPPSRVLREERERRRQTENELANARARIAAYENAQQQRSPQDQTSQAEDGSDFDLMFSNPRAWAAQQRAEILTEIRAQNVNASLGAAHEEHGREFEAAYRALTGLNPQDPVARAQVQRIWNAPNPGGALMRWHKQQQTFSEIGDDPDAWFERRLQERLSDPETRRQTLSSMRSEAMRGDGGRPRTQTRLPRSLNSASGSGSAGRRGREDPDLYDDSEASVFEYAMR
jgi:hypothetical protein